MSNDKKWAELTIKTNRMAEEAVNNILYQYGINGVVIREDSESMGKDVFSEPILIKSYLPYDTFLENKLDELRTRILKLNKYGFQIGENDIIIKFLDENNWLESWKSFFKPKIIGSVVIKPTWEEIPSKSEDKIVIELNPEMAFGTGLHPTTEACLKFIQSCLTPGETVLDLGSGSGILSIAAAKLGARKAYAYDIAPEAYKVTQNNAELNEVYDRIEAKKCDVTKVKYPEVNLVVANLHTKILLNLFDKIYSSILSEGHLIVSGIIDSRREDIVGEATKSGFSVIDEVVKKEWLTLLLKKA
ncbi:50S ribosomal protein L11 methyltransferase [Natranaerofaba carboxydovora]|uniref:50S ribosomal protein L11 methyltransferase n=1 Tax=Natranaerofaba carboxydovora TaxID=2742683 RepID=UPI001F12D4F2|nr:50S ribosomal protein L11 methyltransferase [Natranaerofaba carboxydovora]UMZ73074.1 Ribosomal protein L11 methyltransferase [Natranaerofaba carboxydovora]